MPNIPAVSQEPKPAETPATEQNVSEMTSSIVGRYSIFQIQCTVFENHRKSLIQHCERSELRLHFEWTKVD